MKCMNAIGINIIPVYPIFEINTALEVQDVLNKINQENCHQNVTKLKKAKHFLNLFLRSLLNTRAPKNKAKKEVIKGGMENKFII